MPREHYGYVHINGSAKSMTCMASTCGHPASDRMSALRQLLSAALVAAVCLACLPAPARAQEGGAPQCPYLVLDGRSLGGSDVHVDQTADSFIEEYVLRENPYHPAFAGTGWNVARSPIETVQTFIDSGCDDEAFLTGLVSAWAFALPFEDLPAAILLHPEPLGEVEEGALKHATEFLYLGHAGPLERIIGRLRALRDAGNSHAAAALALLFEPRSSRSFHGTLELLVERHAPGLSAEIVQAFPALEGRFVRPARYEVTIEDAETLRLIAELRAEAPANLDLAARGGSVAAHLTRLFGHPSYVASPCTSQAFMANFADLPDKRAVLRDIQAATDHIAGLEDAPEDLRRAGASMALILANIASDCRYHENSPGEVVFPAAGDSFGALDDALAFAAMRRAATLPSQAAYPARLLLPIALWLDEGFEAEARHHAAARFLIAGLAGNRLAYAEWVPKFPRDTIAAAQGILADHGFYSGGIDGLPGPLFESGVQTLSGMSYDEKQGHRDLLMLSAAEDVRTSAWLSGFLARPE